MYFGSAHRNMCKKYTVNCGKAKYIKFKKKGEYDMRNKNKRIYYVYERFRKDNNTCFYVGRGHDERIHHLHRNELHDKIAKEYGYYNIIFKDGLTLEESCELEKERIKYYVEELGYGIDILGYIKNDTDKFLTNRTFGGEDGFFKKGKLNPQYGISPQQRMGSHYEEWHEKVVTRGKSLIGEANPNYGNNTLHNKVKDNPELRIRWYSRKDEQNGRAVAIRAYKEDGTVVGEFKTIGKCCEYLKENFGFKAKIDSIRSGIRQSINTNKPYRKLYFKEI
jgi:hypothetical protein